MKTDLSQFRDFFLDEAAELLSEMEAGLLLLEETPGDSELINNIFRCAHSIKGGSGTVGLGKIAFFTHSLESLLDSMREGKIQATDEIINLLLRAADVLKAMMHLIKIGDLTTEPPEMAATMEALNRVQQAAAPAAPGAIDSESPVGSTGGGDQYLIRFEPSSEVFRQAGDPLSAFARLSELGEVSQVSVDLKRLPPLAEMNPEVCYLAWEATLRATCGAQRIRDLFAFVEDGARLDITLITPPERPPNSIAESAPQAAVQERARNLDSSSIRVATEKVDRLVDLVGEVVIAQSIAAQIIHDFTPERLNQLREAMAELERNTRELQERVMQVRMLPVGTTFSRFPRLARELTASLGKKVNLVMTGEETELDKGAAERLADPLTHLVRNAIDHGLETVEERLQAGKSETGTICLRALHQSGNVIIEVTDDGRGLNTEMIRAKGIERGLIAADAGLSEEQIHALIFHPGFSTAEKVTDVSGRGVGMDVVKKNIEALNGSVSIESRAGKGTTFRIKLPLTLAILDGLSLKVGGQTYIMPLISILETVQPNPQQVKAVAGQGEVVMVRQVPLPLLRLHQVFSVPTEVTNPSRGLVVIVEHEGLRMGVLVDELLGQQQVVIKSLDLHFRKVEGVLGATILGDGRAALILDVVGLVNLYQRARRNVATAVAGGGSTRA